MKLLRLKLLPIFFCVQLLLLNSYYYIKCHLSFIEVYNQKNRIQIFDNQKLTNINFYNNYLTQFDVEILRNRTDLEKINLTYNQIKSIKMHLY
jgi:hypothetical protein